MILKAPNSILWCLQKITLHTPSSYSRFKHGTLQLQSCNNFSHRGKRFSRAMCASLLLTRSPFIHNGAAWNHSASAQTLLWLKLGSLYTFCINTRTLYKINVNSKERRIFSVASVAISWNHADEPLCYI